MNHNRSLHSGDRLRQELHRGGQVGQELCQGVPGAPLAVPQRRQAAEAVRGRPPHARRGRQPQRRRRLRLHPGRQFCQSGKSLFICGLSQDIFFKATWNDTALFTGVRFFSDDFLKKNSFFKPKKHEIEHGITARFRVFSNARQ